ncbi:hypothetical protein ACHAWF_017164 [Thalassiosira exigua]
MDSGVCLEILLEQVNACASHACPFPGARFRLAATRTPSVTTLPQFWGLGSVIKFPVDLTSSPYSIVATRLQLPSHRVAFPFSLITEGPGGMNQITSGWLLQYIPYTVA